MRSALVVATLLAACDPGGGVSLRFERPEEPALDPLAGPVRELTLHATAAGTPIFQATRPYPADGAIEFGQLPLGEDVGFAITGTAASGRVIGFGRSAAPVDVTADAAIEVAIPVRLPFSYVTGADGLVAIDGALEPGTPYASTIAAGGVVTGAAALSDGTAVVLATGAALRVISTSTHLPVGAALTLAADVSDLAVSPDGRWLVAVHAGATPGLSIVELPLLRAGTAAEPVFVATARPGAIGVTADTAWLIQDPLNSLFCVGASTALAIPLADPGAAPPPIDLGGAAGDLAIDPDGGVVIAMPCANQLVALSGPGATPVPRFDLLGASAVTIVDGRLWAMGHVDGEAAHLILASAPLDGGAPDVLALATLEERAVATALEDEGQGGVLQMTADLASAFDLAVLPDGEHVAILVAAVYLTEPIGDGGGGQPIIPAVTMITYEYQLVQLDTGLGAQRLRTSCTIEWEAGAVLDDFRCGRAPGQDEAAASFTPGALTTLYGSR